MSVLVIAFLGASALLTGFVSGVFGMAGGMVLMGALLVVLPVPVAMVLHGVTLMSANGWRSMVWRRYADYWVVFRFTVGLAAAYGVFFFVSYVPDRAVVLICLGALPFLVLAVPPRFFPQADSRLGAELCGLINGILQFLAGVSGPVLDAFFIHSKADRRVVVATKAFCQTGAHLAKLAYFLPAGGMVDGARLPLWVYGLSVVLAIAGTSLSRHVLEKLSDRQFQRWSKGILLVMGAVYLIQGLYLAWR
jgi:uncharacterized membrane protein YfcA